jgi:hypothetical protein
MYQPEKMDRQLLKARGECPALFQPAQAPLDHVAIAVAHRVVADWPTTPPFAATTPGWDHRADAVRAQPVSDTLRVIGLVAANPPWTAPWTPDPALNLDAIDQGFKLSRLMRRTRQQQRAERQSVAIDQQMQLTPKAAARPA